MTTKIKGKAKQVVASCGCAPDMYEPSLYLDLKDKDVSQIKGLKVGDTVQILVEGKVTGLSQRERPDYEDKKKTVKTGSIDLASYTIEVLGDDNEYSDLAED